MSCNQRFSPHYPSYVTNAYQASCIDAYKFVQDNFAKIDAHNAAYLKSLTAPEQPVLWDPAGSFSSFDPSPAWMDLGGGKAPDAGSDLFTHGTGRSGRGKLFLLFVTLFAFGVVALHFM